MFTSENLILNKTLTTIFADFIEKELFSVFGLGYTVRFVSKVLDLG